MAGWVIGLLALCALSYAGRESLETVVFLLWLCAYVIAGVLLFYGCTGSRPLSVRFAMFFLAVFPFGISVAASATSASDKMFGVFISVFLAYSAISAVVLGFVAACRWVVLGFLKRA